MKQNRSGKVQIVRREETPGYFVQGIVLYTDEKEGEHQFSLQVLGESKEAVDHYLEYLQSEQFPHLAWMVEQSAAAGSAPQPASSETATPIQIAGIIWAEILPMRMHTREISSEHLKVGTIPMEVDVESPNGALYKLTFKVVVGAIQVTSVNSSKLAKPLDGSVGAPISIGTFQVPTKVLVVGSANGTSVFYYETD